MTLRPRNIVLAFIFVSSLMAWLPHAQAALFRNAYISFELPPNWDCKLDGTEWVCVSQYAKQAKEAIIILAAKELGPTDSLAAYLTHLKTPRSLTDKTGKTVPSKVLHVKERLIANHPWIDGLHSGSEVPSYYTRYLATVKDRLAILVTFSSHKDHYTKYSSDFLKAIESLRVVASKDILDSPGGGSFGGGSETIGIPIADMGQVEGAAALPTEPKSSDLKTKLMSLALLLGAIGFYLWRRKK
jgi:hypothetical protein